MTRSLVALLAVAAAGALPAAASASCYFVYSAKNELVYRSTISPVDLSRPISESLRGRFSGGRLVMIPDETGCPDLLERGESQLFAATLGFSNKGAGGRSAAAIDASPLFQNNAGARPGADTVGAGDAFRCRQPAAWPPHRADRPLVDRPRPPRPRPRRAVARAGCLRHGGSAAAPPPAPRSPNHALRRFASS